MKSLLFVAIILCSGCLFSQTTSNAKDTLIWNDGTIYSGTLISQDARAGELKFRTIDNIVHVISVKNIASIKEANPTILQPKKQEPERGASETHNNSVVLKSQPLQTDDEAIDWTNKSIPSRVLLKHRTGIGLSVTGGALFVAGITLLAVGLGSHGQTTTTSTSANVNVGPEGGIGLLCMLVGVPMVITGIVKLTKSKKLARNALIHFRK